MNAGSVQVMIMHRNLNAAANMTARTALSASGVLKAAAACAEA